MKSIFNSLLPLSLVAHSKFSNPDLTVRIPWLHPCTNLWNHNRPCPLYYTAAFLFLSVWSLLLNRASLKWKWAKCEFPESKMNFMAISQHDKQSGRGKLKALRCPPRTSKSPALPHGEIYLPLNASLNVIWFLNAVRGRNMRAAVHMTKQTKRCNSPAV